MKKIVFEIDTTTGEILVDAHGFQGRQCDEALKAVIADVEEQKTVYKTPARAEVQQKQEIDITLI